MSQSNVSQGTEWHSSNRAVADVSSGLVRGLSAGTAVIRATYQNNTEEIYVRVKDKVDYAYRFFIVGDNSVEVGKNSLPYKVYYYQDRYEYGELVDEGTTAYPFDDEVFWGIAEGSDYASMSANGVLQGKKRGTAVISAGLYVDGVFHECSRSVTITQSTTPGTDAGWEEGGDVDYD